jgi:hypothetical protein
MVRLFCAALLLVGGCRRSERAPLEDVKPAIARAGAFLAAFPPEQLRYDAAVALTFVRALSDDESLRLADRRAREWADRDPDNPLRRAWDATARLPASATAEWAAPAPGSRVNVNRVLIEALYCAENGLRSSTLDYIAGPMRDRGGYQTAHGLWALVLARDRGCLDAAAFGAAAAPLIAELRAAQPAKPGPATLDVDLFGERILMLLLAGQRDPQLDQWLMALVAGQQADGGFGAATQGEDPYYRYHATLVAVWSLAEWAYIR